MLMADIVYNILCGLQFMYAMSTVAVIIVFLIALTERDGEMLGALIVKIINYSIYAASITVTLYLF